MEGEPAPLTRKLGRKHAGEGVAEVDVGQGRARVVEVRVVGLEAGEDGHEVALLLLSLIHI